MESKRRLTESAESPNPVAAVHSWRSPAGASVEISVLAHLEVYSAIHQQATESLPNETGGFLLGRVAFDPRRRSWHVELEEAIAVEPVSQSPAHFTFTWRDVDRVRSYREQTGNALVGWYHTHPDLGIFLSETDLEKTHRVLFAEPFQVALVYDPVRHRAGYFFWEGPQIIDASSAGWREFEIAVAPADAPPAPEEKAIDESAAIAEPAASASAQPVGMTADGPKE